MQALGTKAWEKKQGPQPLGGCFQADWQASATHPREFRTHGTWDPNNHRFNRPRGHLDVCKEDGASIQTLIFCDPQNVQPKFGIKKHTCTFFFALRWIPVQNGMHNLHLQAPCRARCNGSMMSMPPPAGLAKNLSLEQKPPKKPKKIGYAPKNLQKT